MHQTSSSSVYEIYYHIVWCPKHRKAVLVSPIKEFLENVLRTIAEPKGWDIKELEVMPDPIHLFISAPPTVAPTELVKTLKGMSARRIFREFPKLKKKEFWGGQLWSPSYYVGTAGHVSADSVEKYIAGTKNRGKQKQE